MKIFVLSHDVYLDPVVTHYRERIVSVFISKNENSLKSNFRCVGCGKIIFQYSGDVEHIFDGASATTEKVVVDIMCGRCKVIYRIL